SAPAICVRWSQNMIEAIEPSSTAREQVLLFLVAQRRCNALHRVPANGITITALVDREIAFEHASIGPEHLDDVLDPWTPCPCKHLRRWGLRLVFEPETGKAH